MLDALDFEDELDEEFTLDELEELELTLEELELLDLLLLELADDIE